MKILLCGWARPSVGGQERPQACEPMHGQRGPSTPVRANPFFGPVAVERLLVPDFGLGCLGGRPARDGLAGQCARLCVARTWVAQHGFARWRPALGLGRLRACALHGRLSHR